jgi:flagellar basal-body rod modification protein FlgD
MAVPSVLGTSTPPTTATTQSGKDQLNMTDFMNLMVSQLENQDPTNPMNADSFFAQMAQLGQVQGMDTLNQQMEVQQAQSLMGKVVTATTQNADGSNGTGSVTGIVTQLNVVNGNYQLGIQDYNGGLVQVNMNAIQSVQPDSNLSAYQGLVGQNVTGIAQSTVNNVSSWNAVTGTVTGLFAQNGQNYAQVQVKDGSVVNMLVGDVRTVGNVTGLPSG